MGWVDIFEIPGVPCCSARGASPSTSGGITLPETAYVLIDNNNGPVLSSGAKFTKIPLSVWQNFTDTNEVYFDHSFTNGGITINRTGNYMISANISFNYNLDPNGSGIGTNYGVYVLTYKDGVYTEVLSAHYFNDSQIGDSLHPQGVCTGAKIIEIEAGTTVFLCGHTNAAGENVKAYVGQGPTHLSIMKV